jgi:hypothetical protein
MFSPERAFPLDKFRSSPYIALVWTKYGGHISFCEGLMPTGPNYTCRILGDYLKLVLSGEFKNELECIKKPSNSKIQNNYDEKCDKIDDLDKIEEIKFSID